MAAFAPRRVFAPVEQGLGHSILMCSLDPITERRVLLRVLGFFSHEHTPHGRGFDSSFGYMLGASSHDNRSSQVSHTCQMPVKDLYNNSHVANDTALAFNNKVLSDVTFQTCFPPFSALFRAISALIHVL